MITQDAAMAIALFCLLIGVFGLLICCIEPVTRRCKLLWTAWVVIWALPLLVPAYLALWLGA